MRTRIWASIVVTFFLVPLLAAQVRYGVITGTVIDTSGAVLPGVMVTLTGPEQRSLVTNSRGEFTFVRLQGGEYRIECALSGFSMARRVVTLAGGRTERITIEMSVGALQEVVTVQGETAVVDVQPARSSQIVGVAGGLPPSRRFERLRHQKLTIMAAACPCGQAHT